MRVLMISGEAQQDWCGVTLFAQLFNDIDQRNLYSPDGFCLASPLRDPVRRYGKKPAPQ